jgi:hypothetical protein
MACRPLSAGASVLPSWQAQAYWNAYWNQEAPEAEQQQTRPSQQRGQSSSPGQATRWFSRHWNWSWYAAATGNTSQWEVGDSNTRILHQVTIFAISGKNSALDTKTAINGKNHAWVTKIAINGKNHAWVTKKLP